MTTAREGFPGQERRTPGQPVESSSSASFPALGAVSMLAVAFAFSLALLIGLHNSGVLGFDFRGTLWDPGEAILSGKSPYPPPHPEALRTGNPAAYPPAVMLVVAPLTLLPWSVGIAVWLALSVAAALAALWLLQVRDWRVYGVGLASAPFLIGLVHGNLTVVLLLGLAVAWRWRDRPGIVGASVAALVVAKLFLWPLLVWLVVTRRLRAAAYAVGYAVVAAVASWAIIGFDGFRTYPDLLRALDQVYSRHSQSLTALGIAIGLPRTASEVVALGVGLTLVGVAAGLVRRADGDRRMYALAVLAGIIVSPIAWIYYYTLLLVPLALYRRVISRAWWIFPAFWAVTFVAGIMTAEPPCCAPPGMPKLAWRTLTTNPPLPFLFGNILLWSITAAIALRRPETGSNGATRPLSRIPAMPTMVVTRASTCLMHGRVQAAKEVPVFSPPGLFWACRRAASLVRPYCCPECGRRTQRLASASASRT